MSGVKKSRGLSLEEKRKRACDFFMEKRDFFQLKELEKMLSKEKGIVLQSVKDVIQGLVDDRIINCEKIGTSNYFWSFPSTALQTRKNKIEDLQAQLEKIEKNIKETQDSIKEATSHRTEGNDRLERLEKLKELEKTYESNMKELEVFKEMDPVLFNQRKKEMIEAKDAVNRWTDNIFILQKYCCDNFNISRSDFNSQFGIPEDIDYLE